MFNAMITGVGVMIVGELITFTMTPTVHQHNRASSGKTYLFMLTLHNPVFASSCEDILLSMITNNCLLRFILTKK